MDQSKATVLAIALFSLLAAFVTAASILIVSGGKLYHRIPEKSRPRRWFVGIWFSYFVTFCFWFAAWFFYLRSIISHISSFLFGAFTAFIAAWYVLGRVGAILSPIIALVVRMIDTFADDSDARKR
jgi:hypothetical protein